MRSFSGQAGANLEINCYGSLGMVALSPAPAAQQGRDRLHAPPAHKRRCVRRGLEAVPLLVGGLQERVQLLQDAAQQVAPAPPQGVRPGGFEPDEEADQLLQLDGVLRGPLVPGSTGRGRLDRGLLLEAKDDSHYEIVSLRRLGAVVCDCALEMYARTFKFSGPHARYHKGPELSES